MTRLSEKAGVSEDDAINLVETTFQIVKAALERGEKVKIHNFGNFTVRSKNPRRGRNPRTGAEIIIPGRRVLSFKASPVMRKTIETTQSE